MLLAQELATTGPAITPSHVGTALLAWALEVMRQTPQEPATVPPPPMPEELARMARESRPETPTAT